MTRSTLSGRPVCATCRWYALASRVIGPLGRIEWRDGDQGRCGNRRSPSWNSQKQPVMSCPAWAGLEEE